MIVEVTALPFSQHRSRGELRHALRLLLALDHAPQVVQRNPERGVVTRLTAFFEAIGHYSPERNFRGRARDHLDRTDGLLSLEWGALNVRCSGTQLIAPPDDFVCATALGVFRNAFVSVDRPLLACR